MTILILLLVGSINCKSSWIFKKMSNIQDQISNVQVQASDIIEQHPEIQNSILQEFEILSEKAEKGFRQYSNEIQAFGQNIYKSADDFHQEKEKREDVSDTKKLKQEQVEKNEIKIAGERTIIIDNTLNWDPIKVFFGVIENNQTLPING
ncbi:UNKNOWN [Stylonychia lemnae]|uniref:Uncharacterized protein n=1 Tax=Stylonychia lemnae TaxID=5949 RepID=A0A078AGD0_STYLE|nr:UNKNOWN [Stylonychia lemnae]|eukprot:CDW80582.1 UNKNOWN [Stylonychia lemnae]